MDVSRTGGNTIELQEVVFSIPKHPGGSLGAPQHLHRSCRQCHRKINWGFNSAKSHHNAVANKDYDKCGVLNFPCSHYGRSSPRGSPQWNVLPEKKSLHVSCHLKALQRARIYLCSLLSPWYCCFILTRRA
ncbi:uncharacterized protein TEOVI_000904000 [Trypanosoma equiperdum]|uniref:Uncharacterized protein n=2 Tax=Trypanozoon TaxID=39700 RepID=Q387R6_TRYB2|nr:hypothetical protein Tb10.229.90 [Trypanosoma brucei brucei TREU927]EAN78956.1 hypothetical protein Tb10.229.90 [Trypanosoma brucei brucei TREU927]SCU66742.1 hypothetical protein, conserved [Trypanosoma equiperdum]